jgi:hypothetical protein
MPATRSRRMVCLFAVFAFFPSLARAQELRELLEVPTLSVTLPWTFSHADYLDEARGDVLQAVWEAYAGLYCSTGPRLAAFFSLRLAKLLWRDERLRLHHLKQAEAEAARIDPQKAQDLLLRAEILDFAGREAESLALLKEALARFPKVPAVYRAVASMGIRKTFAEHFPDEAWKQRGLELFAARASAAKQSAAFYVDYFLFRYHLGAAEMARRKRQEVYAAYLEIVAGLASQGLLEQAVRAEPQEPRWLAMLGGVATGYVYANVLGALVPELSGKKKAPANPQEMGAAFRRAYQTVKSQWKDAHRALWRARELAPARYPAVYRHLAYLEIVRGRYEEGARAAWYALALQEDDLASVNLLLFAQRVLSGRDVAGSVRAVQEIREHLLRVGLGSRAVLEMAAIGKMLLEAGLHPAARETFASVRDAVLRNDKASKEDKAQALALHATALLRGPAGEEARATKELEESAKLAENPQLRALVQLNLAIGLELQGKHAGALEAAQEAARIQPKWKAARQLLSRLKKGG